MKSIGVLVLMLTYLLLAPRALGCSIFALATESEVVYGQNLDWSEYFPGNVVVNPRGIRKAILPWKGSWPVSYCGEPVTWVSRYGSITLTCYGRDFIEGGMNEAGLVIDETSLYAVYPPEDGRPGVSCAQWMQYQLDNYATVDEVLLNLDELRPDGEGWHYLVTDSTGASAAIEYLKGAPTVYAGDSLEVPALTNTTYRQALSHIAMEKAFGGDIDIASGSDSYGRFVRMAALMRDYVPSRSGSAVDYAFMILDQVSCDETLRSVVYDATAKAVYWKTPKNPEVRWLTFASLDFSSGARVLVVDVEKGGPGNVSAKLAEYTVEGNRAIVTATKGPGSEELLRLIAEHPSAVATRSPED
jgi:choloylglycine hydrolase